MGGFFDNLLAPLGIRLGKGGPYPDRGLGDKALDASKLLQTSGESLLSSGTGALPNIYGQLSAASGVANPYAKPGDASMAGGPAASMNLEGPWLSAYNNAASGINARRKAALESAQSNLSAHGLSRSGAAALLQHINKLADDELNDVYSKHMGAAHNEKLNALRDLLGGANQNIQEGGNLISGNVAALQHEGQMATNRTNSANQAFGGALGAGLGAAFPAVRAAAPTGGSMSQGAGMFGGGGYGGEGSPGFVGPVQPTGANFMGGWGGGSLGNDTSLGSVGGRAANPMTSWNWPVQ